MVRCLGGTEDKRCAISGAARSSLMSCLARAMAPCDSARLIRSRLAWLDSTAISVIASLIRKVPQGRHQTEHSVRHSLGLGHLRRYVMSRRYLVLPPSSIAA